MFLKICGTGAIIGMLLISPPPAFADSLTLVDWVPKPAIALFEELRARCRGAQTPPPVVDSSQQQLVELIGAIQDEIRNLYFEMDNYPAFAGHQLPTVAGKMKIPATLRLLSQEDGAPGPGVFYQAKIMSSQPGFSPNGPIWNFVMEKLVEGRVRLSDLKENLKQSVVPKPTDNDVETLRLRVIGDMNKVIGDVDRAVAGLAPAQR